MSQGGKILPNLDQNGTKILNLTVLQRIDPSIEEILMTAAHVAFYEFNIELNQWSRKDVEGSLFVVKRGAEPRFQFIVMNRRNTDNLVENLAADFEYELQVPYLLYRNAVQEVNGIWFYNSRECEEVAQLFDRIQSTCLKLQSQLQVPSSKSEYEELEGVLQASMGGSLESMSASRGLSDVEDSRFANFFNASTNLGTNGSTTGKQAHFQLSSMNLSTSSNGNSLYQPSGPSMQLRSSTATIPSAPSIPVVHPHDTPSELVRKPSQIADLLKPSFFYNPPSTSSSASVAPPGSSMQPTAPLQPSSTTQIPYSAPLLQPFPPPNPPPLRQNPPSMEPVIERDKVRQALFTLAQDNQFVEMVYQALKKVHET